MFLNQHDFALLMLLLIFASLLSISFGFMMAIGITESLNTLKRGVQKLAAGDLSVRVDVPYHDELADVATAFNSMAGDLEQSALQRQELEQSRQELIAAVSHDLRTPLASVRAMVEALADKVVTDQPTIDRYHQTIQGQIASLSLLIDDFFELSKIESGNLKMQLQLESASLGDLISDTLESMRAQAEANGVELSGHVAADVPPVMMEASAVQRVLNNLVQNAIRHTSEGGSVFIAACAIVDGVQVDVMDTGEAISPVDLPRIFDQFYRGEKSRSRETGGAGLGLSIARGIVEAHGGRIWAENSPQGGAVFSFILPVE